jgi:hypothetical protein
MFIVGLLYLTLRLIAYVAWCYAGVLLLSPRMRRRVFAAAGLGLGLGTARFVLGLCVQYVIFSESSEKLLPFMRLSPELIWSYFVFVVPARVVEWLAALLLLNYAARVRKTSLSEEAGTRPGVLSPSALAWLLCGVVLSCLLDLPMRGTEMYFSR